MIFHLGSLGTHLDHFSIHEAVMLCGVHPGMSQEESPQLSTQGPGSPRRSMLAGHSPAVSHLDFSRKLQP